MDPQALISAYEDLGRQAAKGSSSQGLGMALWLGQGMMAWMPACCWAPSTAPNYLRPYSASVALPSDLRGEIVLVLAAMALRQPPEM